MDEQSIFFETEFPNDPQGPIHYDPPQGNLHYDSPVHDQPDAQDNLTHHTPAEVAQAQQELAKLDWQGFLEITDALNALEEQSRLPEAGGFAWVEMVSPGGVRVTFGDRAPDSLTALRRLRTTISYAVKTLNLQGRLNANAPSLKSAPPLPQQTPAPISAAPPIPTGAPPLPTQPTDQSKPTSGTMRLNRMVVKPMPNGRATVEFWGTGRRYVDLVINNWTTENIAKIFPADWTPQHFASPQDVMIELDVSWRDSTHTNSKGNPYKDVVQVRYPGQ